MASITSPLTADHRHGYARLNDRRWCTGCGADGGAYGGAVDLFAGPGGWDVAAKRLGFEPLGIEWDKAACETRRAAGMPTLQADVASLSPEDFGPVEGLIASPPCPTFSAAGKGAGKHDKPHIIACAHELAAGFDSRYQYTHLIKDERSMLTLEPLRWALALRPCWLAFEQVPAVLELWTLFGSLLAEAAGYHFATGILNAEQYGVPQTRKRAILVASLDGPVSLPAPTHERYRKGHERGQDAELKPWISMAEALGWEPGAHAYQIWRGAGMIERHGDRPPISTTRPAPVITTKARTAHWVFNRPSPTIVTTRRSREGLLIGRQLPRGEGENVGGHNWEDGPKGSGDAVRVSVQEASVLQTFDSDYPWQGSRTAHFTQVGNAIPPLLAEHALKAARVYA